MNALRTSTCPSAGDSSRVASSKSSRTGSPTGRRASLISRVCMPVVCRPMDLAGRHTVITGAASGIGRAIAHAFAEEGATVVVADLDHAGAMRTADEIKGHAVQVDVGREEQLQSLVEEAEATNGPIEVFFSNAGITGASGGPPDLTADDWDLLWRVNVMSHVWAAKLLVPKMLDRREGYLFSTASAAGLLTQLGAIGYATTKHAAVAVAEWIAIAYGSQGIRASCLCPQFVNTPMVTEGLDVEKLRTIAEILEPEQVADEVIGAFREERFLILPHAEVSRYMRNRGADHERWLAGMRQLQVQLGGLERRG